VRAFNLASGAPWVIQPQSLQQILDIAARVHEPNWEAVALKRADRVMNDVLEMHGSVAVVNVIGPIFRYANMFTAISGATSIEILARSFGAVVDDPKVSAILLNVDSPGGEVAGISELARAIYAARQKKTVWAYVDDLAASGAYWLAAAAERIIVSDTSQIGSIGVITTMTEEPKNVGGRKLYTIVSSQSPAKRPDPETDEGMAILQATVDDLANVFVEAVARYRAVSTARVTEKFGLGFVIGAAKAVAVGAADDIGTFEEVIRELSKTQPRGVAELEPMSAGGKRVRLNDSPLMAIAVRQRMKASGAQCVVLCDMSGVCETCGVAMQPGFPGGHVVGEQLVLYCEKCCPECKFGDWNQRIGA